jgi:flagellar hook-associated protein 1 FlgK
MEAQRLALDVTGQNIANANTPGYSRRVVDFAAVPPESIRHAGRGVEAQRDLLIERRLEQETTAAHREAAVYDALGIVEVALGTSGRSLDSRLNEFFDSFSRLADAPMSPVARQEVLIQAESLAAAYRDTANRFVESRRDTDRRLGSVVEDINALATRLAALNRSVATNNQDPAVLHMQDEQAEIVRQLSELTDITVQRGTDGVVNVDIADGRALVVGSTQYDLVATASAPGGFLNISINGADITSEITGGKAGGLLMTRDAHIPGYLQRLDDQAFALADAVNTLHTSGYDLDGAAGLDFFTFSTPPVGTTGAARAITVNSVVAADASRIAAAEVALPGDNNIARQLADLRDARVVDGGTATLIDGWGQLVYRVGRDVQTARSEASLRDDIVRQVETLRDQVSGVSLDEEAMHLMKFQRAYEANARFFSVVDQALDVLFNTVGR